MYSIISSYRSVSPGMKPNLSISSTELTSPGPKPGRKGRVVLSGVKVAQVLGKGGWQRSWQDWLVVATLCGWVFWHKHCQLSWESDLKKKSSLTLLCEGCFVYTGKKLVTKCQSSINMQGFQYQRRVAVLYTIIYFSHKYWYIPEDYYLYKPLQGIYSPFCPFVTNHSYTNTFAEQLEKVLDEFPFDFSGTA